GLGRRPAGGAAPAAHLHAGLDEHAVDEAVGATDVLGHGPDALAALVALDEGRREVLPSLARDPGTLGQPDAHGRPPSWSVTRARRDPRSSRSIDLHPRR